MIKKRILWLFCWLLLLPLLVIAFSGGFSAINTSDLALNNTVQRPTYPNPYQPEPNPRNNLYFGDLHIHTSFSADAYVMGVRATPEDAYRFAKGEVIRHAAGYPIQIRQPLDFAAVTDHAEYLGMMRVSEPDVPLQHRSIATRLLFDNKLQMTWAYLQTALRIIQHQFAPDRLDPAIFNATWQQIIAVAEQHYQPGEFTTFVGYEWSSQPGGANLHRNVIYRGGRGQVPSAPFSALDSEDPEALLTALQQQNRQGMRVLAIPHNANLSQGRMYSRLGFNGQPMSMALARLRADLEPVSEILQVKGSSETHPAISPQDEFAGFEIFHSSNSAWGGNGNYRGSYARDALGTGMEMAHELGINPFQFGFIGSSDGHNASSPVDEERYHGKLPLMDGSAALRLNTALLLPDKVNRATRWGSGGLAAVWAPENSRGALFDAIQRKETYATSGTRVRVRFFGGWAFTEDTLAEAGWLTTAYQRGVPMGGELRGQENPGAAPAFIVVAQKDPLGANLERAQIVKLWLDEDGSSREKVFDVALSDNRQPVPSKVAPPLPGTVNPEQARYQNSIGAAALRTVWRDPEFNGRQRSAYYLRVLEIPTPRWSTYDAKVLGISAPEPVAIQERAITSAIWYQPVDEAH